MLRGMPPPRCASVSREATSRLLEITYLHAVRAQGTVKVQQGDLQHSILAHFGPDSTLSNLW